MILQSCDPNAIREAIRPLIERSQTIIIFTCMGFSVIIQLLMLAYRLRTAKEIAAIAQKLGIKGK